MKAFSDSSLLHLIKTDNHIAFTVLVNRYWERLYTHLFYRIKREDEAKDSVQEIFLGLWKNRANIYCTEEDTLAPYLFKSAKYCAIDYFSRPETTIPYEKELSEVLLFPESTHTDEGILLKELENIIDVEVATLPERLSQPYRMSREQHLSIKEIAFQLSISEQTVKNNISTVLARLKIKLQQYNSDSIITIVLILAALKS